MICKMTGGLTSGSTAQLPTSRNRSCEKTQDQSRHYVFLQKLRSGRPYKRPLKPSFTLLVPQTTPTEVFSQLRFSRGGFHRDGRAEFFITTGRCPPPPQLNLPLTIRQPELV